MWWIGISAVSYTHLDVYKRQDLDMGNKSWKPIGDNSAHKTINMDKQEAEYVKTVKYFKAIRYFSIETTPPPTAEEMRALCAIAPLDLRNIEFR